MFFGVRAACKYCDGLVCLVNTIASHHPLGELDHVQPAFLCLDLGNKRLWLVQTLCQVSLGQTCIKAHLPEPLAQINCVQVCEVFCQVTAC